MDNSNIHSRSQSKQLGDYPNRNWGWGGFECHSPLCEYQWEGRSGLLDWHNNDCDVLAQPSNNGSWHHLAYVLNKTANTLSLYVDGVSRGTVACTDTGGGTSYFRIGSYKLSGWPGGSDGYFAGKIDEVRFSNTARSADWIATEYRTHRTPRLPSTAWVQPSRRDRSFRIYRRAQGTSAVPCTITGTGFGSTQGSSTLTFNGTSATASSWSATSIGVTVPVGATTGNVLVTAASVPSNRCVVHRNGRFMVQRLHLPPRNHH